MTEQQAVRVGFDQFGHLQLEQLNQFLGEGWLVVFTECGEGEMLVIVQRERPA